MTTFTVHNDDALSQLKRMDANSVDVLVTSPPYYKMRRHELDVEWDDDTTFELGQEPTPSKYLDHLIAIFREAERVLTDTANIWINIDDKYSGSGNGAGGNPDNVKESYVPDERYWDSSIDVPRKSRCAIPERLVSRLIDELGWLYREPFIWHKPAPVPFGGDDRVTVATEPFYHFSLQPEYHFNPDDIKVPKKSSDGVKTPDNVLNIYNQGVGEAHCSTYPVELAEFAIQASCPTDGVVADPFCGSGQTLIAASKQGVESIGIDASQEHAVMARRRVKEEADEMVLDLSGVA